MGQDAGFAAIQVTPFSPGSLPAWLQAAAPSGASGAAPVCPQSSSSSSRIGRTRRVGLPGGRAPLSRRRRVRRAPHPSPLTRLQVNLFEGTCYLTPLLGAWLADSYWGRYRTIIVFSLIYLAVGCWWWYRWAGGGGAVLLYCCCTAILLLLLLLLRQRAGGGGVVLDWRGRAALPLLAAWSAQGAGFDGGRWEPDVAACLT